MYNTVNYDVSICLHTCWIYVVCPKRWQVCIKVI